ncbi:MAG TPA: head GIN domain-containing protein [Flavisolibacter sp.]
MNKLFLLMTGLIMLASCSKERVSGSGQITTEDRTVSNFTKVSTSGSTNVHISKGANFSVQVKGYSNLLPYFETKLRNNTLEVGYRNGTNVRNDNLEVFVTMPSFEGANISGSADIDVKGVFISNVVDVSISGSGNIDIEGGTAQTLDADMSGSGNIRAFGLTADKADVSISGSGTAEVKAVTRLKANISGSGSVYYKGTPTVESSVSGSGKLVHRP